MRRTPYRGEQKTHLHHLQIASGLNVLRIVTHLQRQAQDQPSGPQRSEIPFARLKKQAIAGCGDILTKIPNRVINHRGFLAR